jgi:hypothetical protein
MYKYLPTIKSEQEALDLIVDRMGWFVVYADMWQGKTIDYAPHIHEAKAPVDSRATKAYRIIAPNPEAAVEQLRYIVSISNPLDIIEVYMAVPGYRVNEERIAYIYGWVPDLGRDI